MAFLFNRIVISASILALASAGAFAADREGRGGAASKPSKSGMEKSASEREGTPPAGGGFGAALKKADVNGDGELSKEEYLKFQESLFDKADQSGDGRLDGGEVAFLVGKMTGGPGRADGDRPGGIGAHGRPGGIGGPPPIDGMIRQMDADGDGKIAENEAMPHMQKNFDKLDADGDGYLNRAELEKAAEKMMDRQGGDGPGRGKNAGNRGAGGGR